MADSPLPIEPMVESFWATYGRFIYTFSQVEQKLLDFLWQLSGVHPHLARAVFQDSRYSNITRTINSIQKSRGLEDHPLYRRAIDQLGYISALRNDMVHKPSSLLQFEGDLDLTALVSNKLKAMPGTEKEVVVKEQTLLDMCHDMRIAKVCISVTMMESFDLPADARVLPWKEVAQTAWRYKPPPQSGAVPKRRKRPQGQ